MTKRDQDSVEKTVRDIRRQQDNQRHVSIVFDVKAKRVKLGV